MKRFLPALVLWTLFIPVVGAQSTIFLVRHAEKAQNGGKDPALSEAGVARAEMLTKILSDAGITAVYTTEFKRTQQTAAPLAKALGINLTTVPAVDMALLVSKLRDRKENALVVGHGNTIPDVIKALGIATPINIGENDYDNLFIVTVDEKPRLVRLHFPK